MDLHGRLHILAFALILTCIVFSGCEVIGEDERLIKVPLPVDTTGHKHVLIEYTGFRCVNCPKAAEAASVLKETYGEQLIVVAMHPASNPFTQGKYDYTCEAADTYYQYMGGTATTSFPTGNVDFAADEQGFMHDFSEWPTLVAQRMAEPASVHIAASGYELTLSADAEEDIRLAVWIVEDSIKGAQALPDGSVDTNYYHRHVLRGTIGEAWGEQMTIGPLPRKYAIPVTLPEGCDAQHCSIVALVFKDTKELLNAIEIDTR